MINPQVTDNKVIKNGKPLRLKTIKEVDGIEHDEWHDVHEDRNGVWYIQSGEDVYEVLKGLS